MRAAFPSCVPFVTLALFSLSGCHRSSKPPEPIVEPAAAASASSTSLKANTVLNANSPQCRRQIGEAKAARLAERCLAVSPASHPPCNVDNACEVIHDEIDRACGLYHAGEAKPAECAA